MKIFRSVHPLDGKDEKSKFNLKILFPNLSEVCHLLFFLSWQRCFVAGNDGLNCFSRRKYLIGTSEIPIIRKLVTFIIKNVLFM